MYPLALRATNLPAKRIRPLRTVQRTALVRYWNARGIGLHVDTYA